MKQLELRAYDKRNCQFLVIIEMAFAKSLHNHINHKGIVGMDSKGNYYELKMEDVDIEQRIDNSWEKIEIN